MGKHKVLFQLRRRDYWDGTCSSCERAGGHPHADDCVTENAAVLIEQQHDEIERLTEQNERIKAAMQMAVDDLEEQLPKSAQSGLMEALAEDLLPAHSMNYRRWSRYWFNAQMEEKS